MSRCSTTETGEFTVPSDNQSSINNDDDYFYEGEEFIVQTNVNNSVNGASSSTDNVLTTGLQQHSKQHQLFFSTDDISRAHPIRKASCISCALCEANANNSAVGDTKRNADGGFPLRKSASCSICTWDIEEFEIDICSSNDEDEYSEESSSDLDNDSNDEFRNNLTNENYTENHNGALDESLVSIPARNRSNSYSQAMEDEVDVKKSNDDEDLLNNTDSFTNIDKRSPPDGGEIDDYNVEVEINNHDNRLLKSSSPKFKSEKNKRRLRSPQNSIERKITQELDEIFGKLHRSFDDEDKFDLDLDLTPGKNNKKSKKGSFRKIIRTPSFLRRQKKSKLDISKSRSVEHLYTAEPTILEGTIKKSVSTMDVSSYIREFDGEEMDFDFQTTEAYNKYLSSIGGLALFGCNETLRYIWHHISSYQHDLIGPFDDFLKFVIEEIQQAYKKCQDLETALSSKVQQQEKETTKIYDDAETAMRQEREQMQEKHMEKEDQIKHDFLRVIKGKDQELQELYKTNTDYLQRDERAMAENQELKQVLERLEAQNTMISGNEVTFTEKNNMLKEENASLIGQVKVQDDTIQQLQEQLFQTTSTAAETQENYDRLLRKLKDLNEEKESLEVSCTHLTSDLEELKNSQQKPRYDKQLSWSTTSSMDFERATSPLPNSTSNSNSTYDENSNSTRFHQQQHRNSLLDSTSYNKASDSVMLLTKRHLSTSSPVMDIDERNRYIQTPSGFTPIKSRDSDSIHSTDDGDVVSTPIAYSQHQQNNNSRFQNNNSSTPYSNLSIQSSSSTSKRRLQYGYPGKTPIRLASSRQTEFKVVFTGDANVGKTSLIRRICHNRFKEHREVTYDADCSTKIVQCNERSVTLNLWDTVGTEKFNSIPPSYFRKSDIVILMYDIHDEASFWNAKKWIRQIHDYTNENIFLFLVGNKSDLHHKRAVASKRGESLAVDNDAIFIETSAKTSENIDRLCDMIATTLLDREETVFIRNDFESSLCSLSYSFKRSSDVSICCT